MKPEFEKQKTEQAETATEASQKPRDPQDASSEQATPVPKREKRNPASPSTDEPIQLVSGSALLEKIRQSDARATLINVWASWCGPCRREFPMLVRLKKDLQQQGVQVLFVSVDDKESRSAAVSFAQARGQSPPLLVARKPLGPFKRALHRDWPGMLPATFLYNANAELQHFWGGPVYEQELRPVISNFLAGKPVDESSHFALSPGKDYRGKQETR